MIVNKTNVDAYNTLKGMCERGYRQDIQLGSFENEKSVYRMQVRPVMIKITEPLNFLYLPKEVPIGVIEKYYQDYIINPEVQENETYTYGSRIMQQIDYVMNMLKDTPDTNQASISISQPSDIILQHPPCLRLIDFKVFDNKLNMTTFWRSNDLDFAFLINQGGMSLLLKDVAEFAGLESGSHFYSSSGTHMYIREGAIE